MTHKHLFIGRTPTSSVLTCSCGRWRHRNAENAIVEVPDRKALQAMVDDMKRDAINLVFVNPAESERLSVARAKIVAQYNSKHPNAPIS